MTDRRAEPGPVMTARSPRALTPGPRALAAATRHYERAVAESLAGHPARSARQVVLGLGQLGVQPVDEPEGHPAAADREATTVVIRLLATLAKSEVEMTGVDQGLATVARATRWAHRSTTDATADGVTGFLRGQEGLVLFRGGRLLEAMAQFDAAIAGIQDTAGRDKWRVLLNRGALFVELGDVRAARTDLARCVQLARRFDIGVAEGIALHNLGCLEFIAGDLPLALRLIDEAMQTAGTTQEGVGHLDRSRVLLAAGLQREADEALTVASAALSRDRCWQDVGEVDLTRAESALLAGDPARARRLAARARDRFRRHGNPRWRRNAELVVVQADLRVDRPLTRLLPHARRLAAEFAADSFPLQARTALLLAAEMEERLGHIAGADRLAATAGPAERADPLPVRLHTRFVQARLALAHGDQLTARSHLRSGTAELAAYQSQFGGIDVQSASAVHGTRLAELDLQVALEEGTPVGVFAAIERGRAASRRLRAVTVPADDEVASLLTELRRTVQSLQARTNDPARSLEASSERRRIADLQRELRARSWQNGGARSWSRPASAAAVRAALGGADRVLVSYAASAGRLVAVLVGRRARLVDLGPDYRIRELAQRIRADLDVLASRQVVHGLQRAARSSLERSLNELDALLLTPLRVADSRVVLVPTGRLMTLPWNLLPSLRGRPVEVVPSATAWLRAFATDPGLEPAVVTALAGPGLQHGDEEVAGIGATWPLAKVLTGAAASPAELRAALSTSDLVHVAAHGEHQPESPMFSSLQMAGGPAFAYEFDQNVQIAQHVVLSACNLGRATMRAGEEALGLTSVLLHLGSQCVVAGVARVNDDLAAHVMLRYHRRLASGQDTAVALAEAVPADPGLAAPFVCFGASWTAPGLE